MAGENVCYFDGQEYSEGSLVCSNGRELKCRDGEWHETGYECEELVEEGFETSGRNDEFIFAPYPLNVDDQSKLFIGKLDTPDPNRDSGYFASERAPCFQFVSAGTNYSVILLKKANCGASQQTCTIKWIDSATNTFFKKYRLAGFKKREILSLAKIGQIHGEDSGWDAADGPDVTNFLSYSTQKIDDGTPGGLIKHRIWNKSKYYVCVTLRLTRTYDSGPSYTTDQVYMHPPKSNGTVETHSPGIDNLTVTIVSGHADPQ
jgi:hypothetical protein